MRIVFIPIDNRPVCYTLPYHITDVDMDIELLMPPRELLGDLKNGANVPVILNWLDSLDYFDKAVIALDTIAYGGLVQSRRISDSFEQVKERLDQCFNILVEKKAKVYAFSSIMRISNNNCNEEEKEYWSEYGEKIFKFSYETSKKRYLYRDYLGIPNEILKDYLRTRRRNFDINTYYLSIANELEFCYENLFDTLVFSKDDCAEYGLNVDEANRLKKYIEKNSLNAFVKTGADEIPLTLLARAIADERVVNIAPIFLNPDSADKISKYEDISVRQSVSDQITLAGGFVCEPAKADILLYVNNFDDEQGELVMGVEVGGNSKDFDLPNKPYIIADIYNANGADNCFMRNFLAKKINWSCFGGYAGWNTTGNTLGSALSAGIVRYYASKFNMYAFKKLQAIRLLDDWAYQANVRKSLKMYLRDVSLPELNQQMKSFEPIVQNFLQFGWDNMAYRHPWDRFFEIEIGMNIR